MKRERVYPFTNDRPPGLTIFVLRSHQNWSLAELAKRTQLSVSQLSRIESGTAGWTRDALTKISEALSIPLEHLFIQPELLPFYKLNPHDQSAVAELIRRLAENNSTQPTFPPNNSSPVASTATKA